MSDETAVPLSHYIHHHADVGVLLTCNSCQRWESFQMAIIVERLHANGFEPADFPITRVAKLVKKPCKHCGSLNWDSRPQWPFHAPEPTVTATGVSTERTSYSAAKKRV